MEKSFDPEKGILEESWDFEDHNFEKFDDKVNRIGQICDISPELQELAIFGNSSNFSLDFTEEEEQVSQISFSFSKVLEERHSFLSERGEAHNFSSALCSSVGKVESDSIDHSISILDKEFSGSVLKGMVKLRELRLWT